MSGYRQIHGGTSAPADDREGDVRIADTRPASEWFSFGCQAEQRGSILEALCDYDYAIKAGDEYIAPRLNRALLLKRLGRIEEAEEAFKQILAIDESHHKSLVMLGNICFERNDIGEARTYYQAAADSNPTYAITFRNMAIMYRRLGQDDLASKAQARYEKLGHQESSQRSATLRSWHLSDVTEPPRTCEASGAFPKITVCDKSTRDSCG